MTPSTSEQIQIISPVTEEPVAAVPAASVADVDRAVAAARTAFPGWSTTPLPERVEVLRRLRAGLADTAEEMAGLITDEMGCPITQSRTIQVVNPLGVLDTYTALAGEYTWREVRTSIGGATALVTREPVGVVAAIIPWNVPLGIAVQKIAPAVLAGCTVVLKPSPEAPLNAYLLAELLDEAGLPPGVVNVVPADREESEHLVTHPDVDKVTFTGSSAAGRRIAALCGHDLRRVTLELGGKSAAIVLDDADLDATVEALRMGSLQQRAGLQPQDPRTCSQTRHHELVERLADLATSMPLGDPHDPATQIGPLVARANGARRGLPPGGRDEGAKTIVGGGRPVDRDRGWYVEPTVLTGVEPDMRIAQEEIFGPVVSVLTYDRRGRRGRIANNSSYGLNGAVFTTDLEHGVEVASRVRTGIVELNGSPIGLSAPMGGVKGSGIGRENGPEGLEPYIEYKAIGITPDLARRWEAALPRGGPTS